MKNFTQYSFLFFLLGACFFTACSDDLNEFDNRVDTQREFAVPLFNATTSVNDLLDGLSEETFVTMGPDDLITLNYKGDVTERSGEDLFGFIEGVPIIMEETVTSVPFNIEGEVNIKLMHLTEGYLIVNFTNPFDDNVKVTLRVPQLTKNGIPFEETGFMVKNGEPFDFWIDNFPMEDYQIESSNDSIQFYYEATKLSTGEPVTFFGNGGNSFALVNQFKFSYMEGFWGTDTLDLDRDTIEIEFFERWSQGEIYFEDPRIEIEVINSIGFPVTSLVNTLNILNVNGDSIELESPEIEAGIPFSYPLLTEVGETKTTNFYFDKNNSNVKEVLGSGPVFVDYDVDAVSNPDGFTERGFLTDESSFRVQVKVELPFRARITDFLASDKFNINFDGYDEVEYIEFKMIAENQIPLGVGVQVYFADMDDNIIDSLFVDTENILDPAPVDGNGDVTGQSDKTTFMMIDAEKFAKVKDAKKLLLEAKFSTSDATNGTIVNIRDSEKVNIRMGMKVGTK